LCRWVHIGATVGAWNRGKQLIILWLLAAVLYVALFVTLAVTTFRKGHFVLFWVGIIFPVLWIVGALMAPSARVETRGVA
jgi:hypothetical protein